MPKIALIVAAAAFLPAPALAQIVFDNASPPPPVKVAGTKTDAGKLECRSQDTLGSRLQAHQVCMTKQQWFQFEQDNKQKAAELQQLTPTRPSN